MSKLFSRLLSAWHFYSAQLGSTKAGKKSTQGLSSTATPPSMPCGQKHRPSLYLGLVFLFLTVSAALAIFEPEESSDPSRHEVRDRGWVEAVAPPCESPLSPGFYEIENEWQSKELYFANDGSILAPNSDPWPEPPILCRPIIRPTFIQEIQ